MSLSQFFSFFFSPSVWLSLPAAPPCPSPFFPPCLPVALSCPTSVCPSISIYIRLCLPLSLRLYLYLSVFVSPCLSVYICICPPLSVSVRLCLPCLSASICICPSLPPLSVRLYLYLSVFVSPCLSVRLLCLWPPLSISQSASAFVSVCLFVCPSSFILNHRITELAPISPLLAQETKEHKHHVSFYYHDLAQKNGIKSHLWQTCLDPCGDKWASNKSKKAVVPDTH